MKVLPKGIFLKWVLSMARSVQYLNEKCYILHSDLHARNWFLRSNGEIVCGDLGCAVIIGKDGYRPKGCPCQIYTPHCAPEAQAKEGKMISDYSFPNDVWQLACCFIIMLNSGDWGKSANKTQGQQFYQLLVDMQTKNVNKRPKINEVVTRLLKMNDEYVEKQQKAEAESEVQFDALNLLSSLDVKNQKVLKTLLQSEGKPFFESGIESPKDIVSTFSENIYLPQEICKTGIFKGTYIGQ